MVLVDLSDIGIGDLNLLTLDLDELNGLIVDLEEAKGEINKILTSRTATWQEAYFRIAEKARTLARQILRNNAYTAVTDVEEYDIPEYMGPLIESISNDNIADISVVARSRRVYVDYLMDAYCGTIEEWAASVSATRKALSMGSLDGDVASRVWAIMIYGTAREGRRITRISSVWTENARGWRTENFFEEDVTEDWEGKYWETLRHRLLTGKAGFWYLLEHGNVGASMSSDKGGLGYPVNPPTRFVQKSKTEAAETIQNEVNLEEQSVMGMYRRTLLRIDKAIKQVLRAVSYLVDDTILERGDKRRIIKEEIISWLADRVEGATPERINELVDTILEGGEILGERIQLGSPQARIRTVQLKREVEERYGQRIRRLQSEGRLDI